MQAVIANQVAVEVLGGSPRDSKAPITIKTDSCVKSKYDDYKQTDVMHASFSIDALPIYEDSRVCEIVSVENPDVEYQEGSDLFKSIAPVSIDDYTSKLRMRNMDVLVVVDQCFVKKQGRELIVLPKFKIQQVVLKEAKGSQTKRHVGLRLLRD